MKKLRVFISGPLTSSGDREDNITNAIGMGAFFSALGHYPFVPHVLGPALDSVTSKSYDYWMDYCLSFLEGCDVLYRLQGESKGADMEVTRAKELGIPVFFSTNNFDKWIKGKRAEKAADPKDKDEITTLYESSLSQAIEIRPNKRNKFGLDNRAFLLARRNGLADVETGVNIPEMTKAIKTGEVWYMKGVGEKTVRTWCAWVTKDQEGEMT